MFINNMKTAFRNLYKQKVYSFINISGLAIGLAVFFLIFLYVVNELSYDRYHDKAERIYRLTSSINRTGNISSSAVTSSIVAPEIKKMFPEIAGAVRFEKARRPSVKFEDKHFIEENFFYSDQGIFDVFSLRLISGNPKTVLKDPNTVVVTKSTAEKYFGPEDPTGRIISVSNRGDFKITGIVEDVPGNSHFKFDFLGSYSTFGEITSPWTNQGWTYLLFPENCNISDFEPKLIEQSEKIGWFIKDIQFNIQPLTEIHLYSALSGEIEANGSIGYLYIYSVIALLILLIACFNFINLSTAMSVQRLREIGIRKTIGANRWNLIKQFFAESLMLCSITFIISLVLVELFLPVFNQLLRKPMAFNFINSPILLFGFFVIAFIVGIISGGYPAFYLSGLLPAKVLKGPSTASAGYSSQGLRRLFVIIQFAISIFLIACTIIIEKQLDFVHKKELGFNKEYVMEIPFRDSELIRKYNSFNAEIKQNSNVLSASAALSSPVRGTWSGSYKVNEDEKKEVKVNLLFVDHNYLETLNMTVVNGRNFSTEFTSDPGESVIMNETAVKVFGFEDPVGKKTGKFFGERTIVGVVKDFHVSSLHEPMTPAVLLIVPKYFRNILVRIKSENISETIGFLRTKWQEFEKNRPFEYSFIDETFDNLYKSEEKLATIFEYFSFLAIFVACLGLFGLASLITGQRTKEIGIRKVLGASVSNIVIMLTKEFNIWILCANIIAWPAAYFAMNFWLRDFAYKTGISIWIFIFASASAVLISLFTVSFQAIKASLINPVDSLKYE